MRTISFITVSVALLLFISSFLVVINVNAQQGGVATGGNAIGSGATGGAATGGNAIGQGAIGGEAKGGNAQSSSSANSTSNSSSPLTNPPF